MDVTRRSAQLAAETSLVSAANAQLSCLRSLVATERAEIEERLRQLQSVEEALQGIDVRSDLDTYIESDKRERGGSCHLGDDDDGGIASALAVLSSHIDGNMGHVNPVRPRELTDPGGGLTASAESLENAIEALFGPPVPALTLSEPVSLLCDVATQASRAQRSSLCYMMNAKRSSNALLPSKDQFDALCSVFDSILKGCDIEDGGVSNAKMIMMLSQTFYIVRPDEASLAAGGVDTNTGTSHVSRDRRVYVKNNLVGHSLWTNDEFW
jgi:hypothetical protein